MRTSWKLLRNFLRTFWELIVDLLRTFWELLENFWRTSCKILENSLKFSRNHLKTSQTVPNINHNHPPATCSFKLVQQYRNKIITSVVQFYLLLYNLFEFLSTYYVRMTYRITTFFHVSSFLTLYKKDKKHTRHRKARKGPIYHLLQIDSTATMHIKGIENRDRRAKKERYLIYFL